MKTLKIGMIILLVSMVGAVNIQAVKPKGSVNKYFVQIPHTQDQCMKMLGELKQKGDPFLSKFYFGCMSGNHTGYAILDGQSVDAVRETLPKEVQTTAKIDKVDKFTAAQIEKMHMEHAAKK